MEILRKGLISKRQPHTREGRGEHRDDRQPQAEGQTATNKGKTEKKRKANEKERKERK
jgi:hypothetical protein